ncbi:MAG: hypothetical protein WAZ34_05005, partial [Rhodocyclaceae bacterium]
TTSWVLNLTVNPLQEALTFIVAPGIRLSPSAEGISVLADIAASVFWPCDGVPTGSGDLPPML